MITYAPLELIALLPLAGSILAFLSGRYNKAWAGYIATGASLAAFLLVLKFVSGLGEHAVIESVVSSWMNVGRFNVDFAFRLDRLSAVMCLVVTGIGTLIHLYSIEYMGHDESPHRFFSYLNLFMFSMLLLVLGANLLVLFVGWEGVGLCSYLLIGFWYKNLSYAAAGRKAFVVNRIGDAGFLIGTFLIWRSYGTLDFALLSHKVGHMPVLLGSIGLIAGSFFVGATGKSAQIPLFVWLPDAMAGPTPVSALIHAATMVTAGVYLIARMHFVFSLAPDVMLVVTLVALATAVVAAITAVTQNDIKKVLAYSTVSQLGFMFMAAGAGAYWVALFHVVTHAFFKACLFLGAGSVIHGCHHEQDMRHMGGLLKKMPITAVTYLISTLAIAGIAPFAGYYSKHAILASIGESHNPLVEEYAHLILTLANCTAFLTAFYMTRSFAMTFLGTYRGHAHPHESPWKMTAPLVILAALATVGGVWLHHALPEYVAPVLGKIHEHASESFFASLAHSWVGLAGMALGFLFYTKWAAIPGQLFQVLLPISKLSEGKFFFDEIYGALIVRPLERLAGGLWRGVDQGIIDFTVNSTGKCVDAVGACASYLQSGQTRVYAAWMLFASFFFLVFYMVL